MSGGCFCFSFFYPSVSFPQVPCLMIGLTCDGAQPAEQRLGCLRPSGLLLSLPACFVSGVLAAMFWEI